MQTPEPLVFVPQPVQVLRTATSNYPPPVGSLLPGSFSVEMGTPVRLWVGVPSSLDSTQRKLVFDASTIASITSPNFLGTPTAPTPAAGNNSGQIATTAYVQTALAAGASGAVAAVGTIPPVGATQGRLWFDDVSTQLYTRFNNQWVIAVNTGAGGGGGASTWGSITGTLSAQIDLNNALNGRQATLVSGSNIKTVNGNSLLGSGDLSISGGPGGNYLPLTGGDLTGQLRINPSGQPSPATNVAAQILQLAGTGDTAAVIDSAGATGVPRVTIRRAMGALNSLAPLGTEQQLGFVEFRGWTGDQWYGGGNIQMISAAAWNTGSAPARMEFQTTPAGSVLPTLRMWLGALGGLVVGFPAGGDRGAGSVAAESMYCIGNFNTGGTIFIQGLPVVLGANNSAGPGFRTMTISNL